jgi:hypothetical protein
MASTAPGMLKTFENRMPAPLLRRFGSPAAAAWTGIFVLIAVFGTINGGGMLLDAMLYPAVEAAATVEPASVTVDLPPPAVRAAVPIAPAGMRARHDSRWGDQSGSRRYRHGWTHRRSRERAAQPGKVITAAVFIPAVPGPPAAEKSAGPVSGAPAEAANKP